MVAVDLRGNGGIDKLPRGDDWTLAGDAAGLIRALGFYTTATLVGHADGGPVCWATAVSALQDGALDPRARPLHLAALKPVGVIAPSSTRCCPA